MTFKLWSKMILSISMIPLIMGSFMLYKNFTILLSFCFISLASTNLEMILIMDYISMMFSTTVLIISSMVLWFSEEYMAEEKYPLRFNYLVLLFILSMIMLITSPNLMSILLGWDGLGLVSYCLVIYYQNPRSLNAGTITILSNRIGDVMILMAISLSLSFGSWDILSMNTLLSDPIPLSLIMIAAMTKSAQIPFSAWLPAAMAAPTPVSALVHSSTLVTAGVFLLIRFHNMMNYKIFLILLISSTLTMFMAGLSATMEMDMKKIIALSTLSQLAIMMLALSLSLWKLAYFHMITHALFKALMFLCAGFAIHNMKNNQDMRKMSLLLSSSPTISTCMMISSITLMGLPFSSAFYSKDLILETLISSQINQTILIITLISFGLTTMYSFRLTLMTLWFNNLGPKTTSISETQKMTTPIITLTTTSIFIGAMMNWTLLDTPSSLPMPIIMKTTSTILILLGGLLSITLWTTKPTSAPNPKLYKSFSGNMWFLPIISPHPTLSLLPPLATIKTFESGWNELTGPQGTHQTVKTLSLTISNTQKFNTLMMISTSLLMILLVITT
uniref:NADH-ubiquinone oxidoreductase chain 5 n=1 Tax=Centruroides limpidus TaxID=6876 RepID=Q5G797_CENLI|nr:NADH dehydrogenase subunit 5 [Centruroides limpidus]AAV53589.1 NADH dehydrogenase subunit 5 [Centruroides limpidus]